MALPYPVSESVKALAEFEYARVIEGTERETPGCVVVHTDNGSFGLAPHELLELGPHTPEFASA
ncbi:hypothetical protein E1091_00325 [Micromonospora fluostatini]|uniref:Uncharacterized protein n=2 Tax=Micromonospora TaxID=1873 RepID=A0ABY2DMB4_9ACTN|nr:hypothetical protein E1091_00325 [Micromonospora fluostatini]